MKNLRLFLLPLLWHAASALAAVDCQTLDDRLNTLASADQQVRQEWEVLFQDAGATDAAKEALLVRSQEVDAANLAELKRIVAACGWPAGKKASHSAWLLAQHADNDLAFQRQARQLLEAAVKAGAAAPRDLAYLADRIAAAEHRPQEYGTQFMQTDRCHLAMEAVDDVALANRRRLAIGLPTLQEYEAEGRRRFIPADCAGADKAHASP